MMKLRKLIPEAKSTGPKLPWTPKQAAKEVKEQLGRLKFIPQMKNIEYHLFPALVKTKIDGKTAAIRGAYQKDEGMMKPKIVYKIEYMTFDAKNKPVTFVKVIGKSRFDKLSKTAGVITPKKLSAGAIKKQAKVYETWLQSAGEQMAGGIAKSSAIAKAAPTTMEPSAVAKYLRNNMKSIKRFKAQWEKDGSGMVIDLPFRFKPTIAKWEKESGVTYYIDFQNKEYGENRDTYEGGFYPGKKYGDFKSVKDLLMGIKSNFKFDRQDKIKKFNDSSLNKWHR